MTDEIELRWLDEAAWLAGWRDLDEACHAPTVDSLNSMRAHARTLREFDAFRREVSEAVRCHFADYSALDDSPLHRFILPEPDPLAEALGAARAKAIREEVEAAGFRIVEAGDA